MKDYLISMFIDNELDLDEKIDFVETVHNEPRFKDEAIDLLEQEKLLHGQLVDSMPQLHMPVVRETEKDFLAAWFRPVALFASGLALGAAVFFIGPKPDPVQITTTTAPAVHREIPHRFVIYRPDADRAEIIGTFTHWQPVSMHKIGSSGYWSLTFNLPAGEHQYSYLVEDGRQITDPTVPERVQDDFGGENSVITVQV